MLGSPLYMAPEILKGETYTIKSDIWSLGVVLYRMLYGECPYQSANIGKLIMIIDTDEMKIPTTPDVSPKVVELLRKMLTKDAKKRCDWNEIFSYKIINGEIYNSGIQRQLTDSGLKGSLSPTLDSSTAPRKELNTNAYSSRDFGRNVNRGTEKTENQHDQFDNSVRGMPQKVSPGYNANGMRSTYSAKTPLRENMKKDMMLKSHSKCLEFSSIMLGLCSY
jgi:serine/threonine protein kinase